MLRKAEMSAYCENKLSRVFSGTSGKTLPTHRAVRPSGFDGLHTKHTHTDTYTQTHRQVLVLEPKPIYEAPCWLA